LTDTLEQLVVERIHRGGPMRYDDLISLALYDERFGFYTSGAGSAGRWRGDFITSPEVGPLFGAVVARALDTWWTELGEPDPFVVIEAAAGRGALAVSVLHAGPRCALALRYVLVEVSPHLREQQKEHLDLEEPLNALGPVSEGRLGDVPPPLKGRGPVVVSVPDLPGIRAVGVVVANELLDNLPFRLLELSGGEWREVRIGVDERSRLCEVSVAAHPTLVGRAKAFAPDTPDGGRIPFQQAAASWVRDAVGLLDRGRVVAFDYGATTPEMATRDWREWLRTYRDHDRGRHPLELVGFQDVTCDVAVDQLDAARRVTSDRAQSDWLRSFGLDALVADGTVAWDAGAAAPDLAAVEGRSRLSEAAALTAVPGLGAHRVLEWLVR